MIKANELRIGNIVKAGLIYITVKEITSTYVGSNELISCIPYSRLRPVQISPEILEACGFEKRLGDANGQVWGILNFTLIYGRTDDGDFGWFLNGYHNDCHLQYLHQLQNLFFILRGTELTINLEKVKV